MMMKSGEMLFHPSEKTNNFSSMTHSQEKNQIEHKNKKSQSQSNVHGFYKQKNKNIQENLIKKG